jgi:hypothetical protein
LKARQLRIKHINYGQKNEIGEKSREIEETVRPETTHARA